MCFCGDGRTKFVWQSLLYLVHECVAPVILTPRPSHILLTLIVVCIRITNGKPPFPKASWINLPKGSRVNEDTGLKIPHAESVFICLSHGPLIKGSRMALHSQSSKHRVQRWYIYSCWQLGHLDIILFTTGFIWKLQKTQIMTLLRSPQIFYLWKLQRQDGCCNKTRKRSQMKCFPPHVESSMQKIAVFSSCYDQAPTILITPVAVPSVCLWQNNKKSSSNPKTTNATLQP